MSTTFNWSGLVRVALIGLIGGATASLSTGHTKPGEIGVSAVTGLVAAVLAFFEPSHTPTVPPTNAEIVAAAATAAKLATVQEIAAQFPAQTPPNPVSIPTVFVPPNLNGTVSPMMTTQTVTTTTPPNPTPTTEVSTR